MPRVLASETSQQQTAVSQAATLIQQGGLVAFPTETVYGLGADGLNATAVSRIFAAKQRPFHDPIILHLAEAADLTRVARNIPAVAWELAREFWPGPLTMVLHKADCVPDIVTAGGATVAVRCPRHPLAQALIKAAGTPIAAPSANRFSHTSPTTAQHVWDDLAGRIDMILDGGATPIGVESTVLDLTQEPPVLLRPGGVTLEALTAVLGNISLHKPTPSPNGFQSPGLLDTHYAPQAELRLFTGSDVAIWRSMRATVRVEMGNGRCLALLLAEEDQPAFDDFSLQIGNLGSVSNLETVAQNLFHTLRALDATDADLILARDFPNRGIGRAIRDRLRRAAKVIVDSAD